MYSKKHLDYIDIAKGLGMILVVMGHTIIINKYCRAFIFSFHMPVFFMVSGMTFKQKDMGRLLFDGCKRLLVPYFVTAFAMVFIFFVRQYITPQCSFFAKNFTHKGKAIPFGYMVLAVFFGNCKRTAAFNNIPGISYIWFFNCLFMARLMFGILEKRKAVILGAGCFLLSVLGIVSSKYIRTPFNIDIAMVSLIFMYEGYVLRKYGIENIRPWQWGVIVFLWLLYIKFDYIEMAVRKYPVGILCLVTASCGAAFFLKLCTLLENTGVKKPFIYLGKNSHILLCCHTIETYIFNPYTFVKTMTDDKILRYILCFGWKMAAALIMMFIVIKIKDITEVCNAAHKYKKSKL